VDLHRREISRLGAVLSAERRVFDLLIYLIENRDRAIGKDELQQAVWAGSVVSRGALTQCVVKLRRLIGDDPGLQTIIKTVHGHGYHFIASLKEPSTGEDTQKLSQSFEAYQQALRAHDRLTIGVLPFKDLGNDPDDAYFAEGMSEDIITELSRFSSLFVIAPTTMAHFKDFHEDLRTLARELDIAYVLQGIIRRTKTRIRITVHLTEAVSERRLWSEHYDRELKEVPIIHDEVARTIAATIGGRAEAHRVRQPLNEAGVKAYDLILRAKALPYGALEQANAEARMLLERAIESDPNNARAHAWLASVHSMAAWGRWVADPENSRLLALEAGRKALAMDDCDYVIQAGYAELMHYRREFDLAESHYIRALELNPNDIAARGGYSLLLVSMSRAEEALHHVAVAERLDPFGLAWTPWAKGTSMFAIGRYQDAIRSFSWIESTDYHARIWLSAAYVKAGDLEQGRIVLENFLRAAHDDVAKFPGKDPEAWKDFLRGELIFQYEEDFENLFLALIKAGWIELIDALPDKPPHLGE
jgi:TolB-like protein